MNGKALGPEIDIAAATTIFVWPMQGQRMKWNWNIFLYKVVTLGYQNHTPVVSYTASEDKEG